MIELLEPFKVIGEQFSKESDVTITLILPCFKHLQNKVLNPKPDDSPMIKEMKTHMLRKLNNRYNDQQMAFLTILTYLDPRFKCEVNPDMTLLISKIKKIVEATGPNIIPPTQNQEYHNLQNQTFATATPSSSNSRAPSHRNTPTGTGRQRFLESFFESDSEDDIGDAPQVDEKIKQELFHYNTVKFTSQQKQKTHLLEWWRAHKTLYPCLAEAVKALLHTPATSVPSESIF